MSMRAVTYVEADVPGFAAVDRAVGFDGHTWLTRGAGLSGAADSKLWSGSFFVYADAFGGFPRVFSSATTVGGSAFRARIEIDTTSGVSIFATNAAGTGILDIRSGPVSTGAWHHVAFAFDLSDPTKCLLLIDGVTPAFTLNIFTNDTIDFTLADWSIGAGVDGTQPLTASLADVWIAPGVYVDFSANTTLLKFRRSNGLPAYLGASGSLPTGSAPLVFMSGAPETWRTNKGTGGGFTLTDSFSPSDASFSVPADFLETFRWALPSAYLVEAGIDCIPSLTSVSFSPSAIDLGGSLGVRASLTANFADHLHVFDGESVDAGTFFSKWRGRYGTKLRNRKLRLIRGFVGQTVDQMETRHYLIDSSSGPTPDGSYALVAKDVLKFADDDRSQAPALSDGSLAGSIDTVTTSATLSPTGIGNLEYPASGYVCIGGNEVCAFTRSGDALTLTRGDLGSVASSHSAGDRVQLALRYSGDDVADIIYDLLTTYASVPASYITLGDWTTETATYLGQVYAATITEPTPVRDLVNELIKQAALAVWWDDLAQQVRLQVLREISTDADTFDESRMLDGSLGYTEQPDKRVSESQVYFNQRDPTVPTSRDDNYGKTLLEVDLAKATEYGSSAITKVQARWIATESAAQRLGQIVLSRFRDPPRAFAFDLAKGEIVDLGGGYQLEWRFSTDERGEPVAAKIQVTRIVSYADRIHVEAEEMLASGVVTLTNVVILTDAGGLKSLTVPATWNSSNNSVACIAGGGAGGNGTGSHGGGGGGGGAFSSVTNLSLTPGASASYQIGDGGVAAGSKNGGDTWFNGATLAASSVGAKGGTGGADNRTKGTGGQASAGVGTTKTSGGDGGTGGNASSETGGGAGGGGAGGPNGNGAAGGSVNTNNGSGSGGGGANGGSAGQVGPGGGGSENAGDGGNNRFGFGGGTAASPTGQQGGGGRGADSTQGTGGSGGNGEQLYTSTVAPIISAGPGGGGGGGREGGGGFGGGGGNKGGRGGKYGGGGGGSGGGGGGGGDGYQGVIVLTWQDAA